MSKLWQRIGAVLRRRVCAPDIKLDLELIKLHQVSSREAKFERVKDGLPVDPAQELFARACGMLAVLLQQDLVDFHCPDAMGVSPAQVSTTLQGELSCNTIICCNGPVMYTGMVYYGSGGANPNPSLLPSVDHAGQN